MYSFIVFFVDYILLRNLKRLALPEFPCDSRGLTKTHWTTGLHKKYIFLRNLPLNSYAILASLTAIF